MELHNYKFTENYKRSVAYFSMEFAIHQALKIYSGGLGFLAGSHMRSAYDLKQNIIGVGILWSYGYYDQARNEDRSLKADFIRKNYSYLKSASETFLFTSAEDIVTFIVCGPVSASTSVGIKIPSKALYDL